MKLLEYLQDYGGSFDSNAKNLYDALATQGIEIEFEINRKQSTWGMQEYPAEKRFVISQPDDKANPSAMIHELLHIELALKGYKNNSTISKHFAGQQSYLATNNAITIISAIVNKLAHLKMIGPFRAYGYAADSFLQESAADNYANSLHTELRCLQKLRDEGMENSGRTLFVFIYHIGAAKLYALYPEPAIAQSIISGLKSYDAALFDKVEALYDQWIADPGYDSVFFFEGINLLLQGYNVPENFFPALSVVENAICTDNADIFGER